MEMPRIMQGESLTRLWQGAAVGAVLTVAVGFNWFGYGFGWVTSGQADAVAVKRVEAAVVAVLAPICAEKFALLPDADEKKALLQKTTSSYDQERQIPDKLTTLPGKSYRDSDLARACTKIILSAQPRAAELKQ
jgi:hypothetical protein